MPDAGLQVADRVREVRYTAATIEERGEGLKLRGRLQVGFVQKISPTVQAPPARAAWRELLRVTNGQEVSPLPSSRPSKGATTAPRISAVTVASRRVDSARPARRLWISLATSSATSGSAARSRRASWTATARSSARPASTCSRRSRRSSAGNGVDVYPRRLRIGRRLPDQFVGSKRISPTSSLPVSRMIEMRIVSPRKSMRTSSVSGLYFSTAA